MSANPDIATLLSLFDKADRDDSSDWLYALAEALSTALAAEHERAETLAATIQRSDLVTTAGTRVDYSGRSHVIVAAGDILVHRGHMGVQKELTAALARVAQMARAKYAVEAERDALAMQLDAAEEKAECYRLQLSGLAEECDALARQVEELKAQAVRDNEALTRMQNAGYAAEARIEELTRQVEEMRDALVAIANNDRCCSDHEAAERAEKMARTALAALADAKGAA